MFSNVFLDNYIIHVNYEITNGYITEVNDIGTILTNVERIPLTVCKRIVKSLLISEYSYICNISECYVCKCDSSLYIVSNVLQAFENILNLRIWHSAFHLILFVNIYLLYTYYKIITHIILITTIPIYYKCK